MNSLFFILIAMFFGFLVDCQKTNVTKKVSIKKSTTKKATIVSGNTLIKTLGLTDWDLSMAALPINAACQDRSSDCESTFNDFTMDFCQQLTYFKTPVCGGFSCFFNPSTRKCDGQCKEITLEKCVSRAKYPSSDSDCVCATSIANSNATFYDSQSNVLTIGLPSCNASTCYGNSCDFSYISVNRQTDGVLYAYCNNDFVGIS